MKNNKTYRLAFSSVLILALVMMMGPPAASGQQSKGSAPVTVVNNPGNPVPTVITGTTSISGDVNARQAGSWTVSVGNIPSVEAQQSGVWKFAIDPLQNVVQDPGLNTRLETANSHLANIDTATSQLRFDGSGNLKTAPQGTQNINIVGGTITSAPAVASRQKLVADTIDPGAFKYTAFDSPISASAIFITTQNDIDVEIVPSFPNLGPNISLGHITGGKLAVINLTQQIPISGVMIHNPAVLTHATFNISVTGN